MVAVWGCPCSGGVTVTPTLEIEEGKEGFDKVRVGSTF